MTDWEVANKVTLPWVRSGIIGATVLGLGRALGETIAIAMIGGASLHIPPTIYLPFTTVAATILTQLDGALTDGTGFAVATLAELALVLAVISVGVNLLARMIIRRTGRVGAPVGGRLMASTTLAGGPTTRRRRVSTITWRLLTYLALVLIMAPAAWLLLGVIGRALPHWQWSVLWTQLTPTGGGLRDQILGTLILMLGVFIIAGTIGVLAGIHLAEFTQPKKVGGRLAGPLRTASDILSGFPSIVLGYVGYVALVVGLHWGFSLLSALIILSIMVIPYIAKTTENSLRQVPTGYREGAAALGMSAGYGLRKVVLKSALPGIATGLLLALAIACGETAPLIYTAGFSNTLPHSLTHAQFPYLTYVVFTYYNDPSVQKHYVSYDAALILVVIVLLLLVASRVVVARTQRHSESARTVQRGFFTRFRSATPPPPGPAAAPAPGDAPPDTGTDLSFPPT